MSAHETTDQTSGRFQRRPALLACGYLFFGLGMVGIALPVLPTTVFWIIGALFFARSSPKMYQRILTWPRIGAAVEDFVSSGVIRPQGKVLALTGMVVAAIVIVLTPLNDIATAASLAGIAVGACYVLTRPSGATE